MTRFTVLSDPAAVEAATADRVVEGLARAVEARGVARVALSGGGTPKRVYPRLLEPVRRDAVDWAGVDFFWGDERAVPPDHPESNFGVAYGMFLSQLRDVRPERIHRMPAEAEDREAAALSYESEMRLAFDTPRRELPAFDLVWLGMGPDGHTASLFPGSEALDERDRWVVATRAAAPQGWRMTLTLPVLNAAREVIFAATGADKAAALHRVRAGDQELPAARVSGDGVEWIVDAAAAGESA